MKMGKNPEEFMYECPKCGECFFLGCQEISGNTTYTCQNCGEEIRFAAASCGALTGNSLDELAMECPQCGGSFILNLIPRIDGNISFCEECGAEMELTEEILRQIRDDLHGIERRNCD
ncbi:MAG TPA: hypothetical protein PK991_11315 [Candidatus Sabulitectum sp.]|nr:hypothetical protein [Candidatus Sabulitectum sp.]